MKKFVLLAATIAFFSAGAPAKATVVLGFDGIATCEATVGSYYNGGHAGDGSGPGPSDGITFSSNAITLQDYYAGGTACGSNTGNMPSPPMGLFFLSGTGAFMDVPAGFDTGFSFFYTAENVPGSIEVYSGLDGTGTLLATLSLPTNDSSCVTTPTFCNWTPVGVAFSGIAESVDFAGTENQIVFDNITLGSVTPGGGAVPEPTSLLLLGSGLVGLLGRKLGKA
jgi:hypothetical protein